MKVLVILNDPNPEGLVAACAEAARQGIIDGHSPARVINIADLKLARCALCGEDGWGTCRTKHECEVEDDFQSLHESVREAQGYVFVTGAVFSAMDEGMRAFLDRLRRCEATREESSLFGKPAVGIAVAPESSAEAIGPLTEIARVIHDVKADPFDLIPVSPRTRDYQLETIHDALAEMVSLPPALTASLDTRRKAEEAKKKHTTRKRRRR